jgi:excinuclease ABC subunit A
MYIWTSRGLHQKHGTINKVLLRDLGNTVIVEHDEDIMKAADMIIDMVLGSLVE